MLTPVCMTLLADTDMEIIFVNKSSPTDLNWVTYVENKLKNNVHCPQTDTVRVLNSNFEDSTLAAPNVILNSKALYSGSMKKLPSNC